MSAYEIQLRYVIRDKIQSETNSARDKIQEIIFGQNFVRKKYFSEKRFGLGLNFVSDFQCTFFE